MQKTVRFSVLIMFFLVCIMAPCLNAQRTRPATATEETFEDAYTQAKIDANEDVSKIQWFGCGCTVYGVGIAYLWGVKPDETRFIGKSSEYIALYTKAYKQRVRSIRTRYAILGCGVTSLLAMTGCIIAMSQEECDPSCGLDDACADPLGLNSCMENFESSGCYEPGTGCTSPASCQDEADCATSESCGTGDGCGSSSSSSNCGGSADYLTK